MRALSLACWQVCDQREMITINVTPANETSVRRQFCWPVGAASNAHLHICLLRVFSGPVVGAMCLNRAGWDSWALHGATTGSQSPCPSPGNLAIDSSCLFAGGFADDAEAVGGRQDPEKAGRDVVDAGRRA